MIAFGSAWSSLMSTPAQKPFPSARTITTRVSGSFPAAATKSASSNHAATLSALTGGTSMVISAMPSESERVIGMHQIF